MKKKLKGIVTIMAAIICCTSIGGGSFVNAIELDKDNQQLEGLQLRPLGYTIDEIRHMKLGQYYQELFPEIWQDMTNEEKEFVKDLPYPSEDQRASSVGVYKGTTSIKQVASKQIQMTAKTYKFLIGPTAKKLHHSYVFYDRSGSTYGGGIDSAVDTTSHTSTMKSGATIPVGKIMRAETVHTVTFPSGYTPSVQTFTSLSGEIKVSY